MQTTLRVTMMALAIVALGMSFAAAWADEANLCTSTACASACAVMTVEECRDVCPPECVVICEESVSGGCASAAEVACGPGCALTGCGDKATAATSAAVLDPSGQVFFHRTVGHGDEILK